MFIWSCPLDGLQALHHNYNSQKNKMLTAIYQTQGFQKPMVTLRDYVHFSHTNTFSLNIGIGSVPLSITD